MAYLTGRSKVLPVLLLILLGASFRRSGFLPEAAVAGIRLPVGLHPALMTGFEAGMMGYAIYGAVYGTTNIFKFAVVDLGHGCRNNLARTMRSGRTAGMCKAAN